MSGSGQHAPIPTMAQKAVDQERLELLDLLLEAGADGFLDWHLDDGSSFYSPRFKLMLGHEDEEFSASPWAWLELAHPEDRVMVAKALEDLIAGDWPFDLIFRMKHRVTGWRWLRGRAVARRDDSGSTTRIVGVFSDVDAQVRAEQRQAGLINAIPDLLIRVQRDSSVVHVKIPEGQANYAMGVPQPGEPLTASAFAQGWSQQAALAIVTATGERMPTRFEARLQHPYPCDIEVRVSPSSDEEILFVIRDITTEKQQREQGLQSQKLEAIGQLAAGIAHEINTPLQFVGDNLQFLSEATVALTQILAEYRSAMPEELLMPLKALEVDLDVDFMAEHLGPAFAGAIDGVQRVSAIVQAMKSFSHPGNKEKRLEDINHAIETTITISTNEWKYLATIERALAPDLPKIECVVGEINQVLLNLITNAAHAIGDVVGDSGARGCIRISTHHDDSIVEIRISDSGPGIPEAVRSRIFEPFFTTKAVGRGTGQGLPLARAIVLKHQGSLHFETKAREGTTFILRLPIAPSAPEPAASPSSRPHPISQ